MRCGALVKNIVCARVGDEDKLVTRAYSYSSARRGEALQLPDETPPRVYLSLALETLTGSRQEACVPRLPTHAHAHTPAIASHLSEPQRRERNRRGNVIGGRETSSEAHAHAHGNVIVIH